MAMPHFSLSGQVRCFLLIPLFLESGAVGDSILQRCDTAVLRAAENISRALNAKMTSLLETLFLAYPSLRRGHRGCNLHWCLHAMAVTKQTEVDNLAPPDQAHSLP